MSDQELRAAFVDVLVKVHGPAMPPYYVRIHPRTEKFDSAITEQQFTYFKAGYGLGQTK